MTVCSLPSAVFAADKDIDGIEINGVDIAIGGTPNLNAISVPSGAKYKITEKYWQDNTHATDFSQFLDLHKYTLNIAVEVDEGYAMDYAPFVKVNGKEHAAVSIVQYDKNVYLRLTFSFLKPIKNIDLPAFPATVPMGETYDCDDGSEMQFLIETETYFATRWWRQRTPGKGTTGKFVFAEGAMYAYQINVGAKSGYEITADTVFTVGGKAVSRDNIYHYFEDTSASICQLYNHTSLKPISTVDITVAAPAVDKKIDTQAKTTTAGVNIDEFFIQETVSANVIVPHEMGNTMLSMQSTSGNYVSNKQYIAKGYIEVADGYYFAENLTVRVNGKKAALFPSLRSGILYSGSPTHGDAFIVLMGKAANPTTTTTTKKPTEAKPTTTTTATPTTSVVDDQSDIGEPTDAVTDDSIENTAPVEDAITDGATDEKKSSVLPIVLAVVGGVVLLGGAAVGVFLFLKKKNG